VTNQKQTPMISSIIMPQLFPFGSKRRHKKKNGFTSLLIGYLSLEERRTISLRLSLLLRKGKEELDRLNGTNSVSTTSLTSTTSNSSLHRRLPQTEADTEFISSTITKNDIQTSINETKNNAEELNQIIRVKTLRKYLRIIDCQRFYLAKRNSIE
jgi:hypothetical protein